MPLPKGTRYRVKQTLKGPVRLAFKKGTNKVIEAKKLKGKEVELIEVKEGSLLRPVVDAVKEARGCLKGRHFSTQRYFQMKREQKRTER